MRSCKFQTEPLKHCPQCNHKCFCRSDHQTLPEMTEAKFLGISMETIFNQVQKNGSPFFFCYRPALRYSVNYNTYAVLTWSTVCCNGTSSDWQIFPIISGIDSGGMLATTWRREWETLGYLRTRRTSRFMHLRQMGGMMFAC